MVVDDPAILEAPAEEDWFGEGSAFDSGEDLAAALFALAGAVQTDHMQALPPEAPGAVEPAEQFDDGEFEILEPRPAPVFKRAPVTYEPDVATVPRTWSVRTPGVEELPPRQPGRFGWSMRNSLQLLRRTEQVMLRLREDAVLTTFAAAARALSPEG